MVQMLTHEQIAFYRRHGYLIIRDFLTPQEIESYKSEAQTLVNHCYEHGDIVTHWGCVIEPLGCGYFDTTEITPETRTTRYAYTALRNNLSPLSATCTLDKFGHCAQQLIVPREKRPLGQRAFLLNDQYIVKPPGGTGAEFAWHQDILYFSPEERCHPMVSVWTPLDNVHEGNGTVLVDPFPDSDRPGVYDNPPSALDAFYAMMNAGSALFMDGRLRHCSSGNASASFRTVYMPQFSLGRMASQNDASGGFTALAVPLAEPS
ncbi:hypothetical protein LPJ66_004786 [Kickxella alabastrina]|uniref:Uncharacterized protein n=1 Tax=Kickxella alabastrina TaxID=61397 RepID=A0ACC1IGY3_9FUNG|nr:hypothetical protein LPJ66_004786 [Kickxella alabastrina]